MYMADDSKLSNQKGVPVKATAHWRSPMSRRETHVLDTTMKVRTPENISFDYQITGPFQRAVAYGLDLLISLGGYFGLVFIIYLLFVFVVLPLASMLGGNAWVEALMGVLAGLISIGYFLVYWFYGTCMETYFNGQTFGKRITNMRVISTDGHAIDGVQATLRNFFRLLDIMPMVPLTALIQLDQSFSVGLPSCLVGLVIMTLGKNFQRVGDLVAGTVVVIEERKRRPNLETFLDDRVPQLAELIPTGFVAPASMVRVIADYIDRRKYLPFQRASEIAGHLAVPLMEKLGIRPDTDYDLFLCAFYYRTFMTAENNVREGEISWPGGGRFQPASVIPVVQTAVGGGDRGNPGRSSESRESRLAGETLESPVDPNLNVSDASAANQSSLKIREDE